VVGVEQGLERPLFAILPSPLLTREGRVVGLLAVERSTQVLEGLDGQIVGLGVGS
jgi:hypothetical protein